MTSKRKSCWLITSRGVGGSQLRRELHNFKPKTTTTTTKFSLAVDEFARINLEQVERALLGGARVVGARPGPRDGQYE